MNQQVQRVVGIVILCIFALAGVRLAWRLFKKSEDPVRILVKLTITGLVMIFLFTTITGFGVYAAIIAAGLGVFLGALWAPHIGALLARPFTAMFDGGDTQVEERPFYSIAEARRKFGRHPEAIAEIRKQLSKFPQDFQGWMMLAEIYWESYKDLENAKSCIEEILSHGTHTPKNIAYALTRLGEWHLALGRDRAEAVAAFRQIIERFPDTELAHNAEQRVAHLTSDQMLAEQTERPTIALPQHPEHIGLAGKTADPRPPEAAPAEVANRLVTHLAGNPFDYEAREELARLYAGHYKRLDLAQDQLEQLIGSPNQSPKHVAHWLNMLADFRIAMDTDAAGATAALQRIIDLYPKSALAANAEKRIAYITLEIRKKEKSQVFKLGSYDSNIGLKGQVPRR